MMSNKFTFFAVSTTVVVIPLFMLLVPTNVYAGGPRLDWPEDATDEGKDCWVDGFDDGANNNYDEDRQDECQKPGSLYEGDNLYNEGFEYSNKSCDDEALLERSSAVREDCRDAIRWSK